MSKRRKSEKHAAVAAEITEMNFAPFSSRRIFVIGGIALILVGMIFGDIIAAFVLHPNSTRIGEQLLAATQAVAAQDANAAGLALRDIGGFLENRGTKVDAHVHMIGFGYLAMLLALLQPYVAIGEQRKKFLANLFVLGAALLPTGVFLIHYVGLAYSPLESIGWASIFADLGGVFVALVCAGELAGLWIYLRAKPRAESSDELLRDRRWSGRALLAGGTLLVLLGFFHGAYYAGVDLFRSEARDAELLSMMTTRAAASDVPGATQALMAYGQLQADKAVHLAAHAHFIEFGILAILLAFFQPYIFLNERWTRIWAMTLLAGSFALPSFVLLELQWGLLAGGLADAGGFLVIVALAAMLVGVWRYTGKLDAAQEAS